MFSSHSLRTVLYFHEYLQIWKTIITLFPMLRRIFYSSGLIEMNIRSVNIVNIESESSK